MTPVHIMCTYMYMGVCDWICVLFVLCG